MRYATRRASGVRWSDGGSLPVACCVDCGYSFGPIDGGFWVRPGGWTQAYDGTWYLTARARRRKPKPGGELIDLPLEILCPGCGGERQTIDPHKL